MEINFDYKEKRGLGQFGDGTFRRQAFRRWWSHMFYKKKCVFEIQQNCPIIALQGTGEKESL